MKRSEQNELLALLTILLASTFFVVLNRVIGSDSDYTNTLIFFIAWRLVALELNLKDNGLI